MREQRFDCLTLKLIIIEKCVTQGYFNAFLRFCLNISIIIRLVENNALGDTDSIRNVLIFNKLLVSLAGGSRVKACASPCKVSKL
jgi:hypothetical protein